MKKMRGGNRAPRPDRYAGSRSGEDDRYRDDYRDGYASEEGYTSVDAYADDDRYAPDDRYMADDGYGSGDRYASDDGYAQDDIEDLLDGFEGGADYDPEPERVKPEKVRKKRNAGRPESDGRSGRTGRVSPRRSPGKEQDPGRKKIDLFLVGEILFAAVFFIAAGMLIKTLVGYQTAVTEYEKIDEAVVAETDPGDSTKVLTREVTVNSDIFTYPDLEIDYDELLSENPEFVGVLYIPVLDIRYPVVQTTDNEKYLHTTFSGTTNSSGCLFEDYRSSSNFTDYPSIIYGHNMKNDSMFGKLKKFDSDTTLCGSDPYMYLYTPSGVHIYEIFSYYVANGKVSAYTPVSAEEYDSYVSNQRSLTVYTLPEDSMAETAFAAKNPLLLLSTCYGTGGTQFFLVEAVELVKAPLE